MHSCPKCGYEEEKPSFDVDSDKADFSIKSGDDSDAKMKDDVLTELMEVIESKLGDGFKGKPVGMSVEMLSADPKKDDEEEF